MERLSEDCLLAGACCDAIRWRARVMTRCRKVFGGAVGPKRAPALKIIARSRAKHNDKCG
jgi:hypothetical protein